MQGRSWVGCRGGLQGSRPDVRVLYCRTWRREGGERSCLPVAVLKREYQNYFDLHGGDVCSFWLSLKQHENISLSKEYLIKRVTRGVHVVKNKGIV